MESRGEMGIKAAAASGDRDGEREPAPTGESQSVRLTARFRHAALRLLASAAGRDLRLRQGLLLAAALLGACCAVLSAGRDTAYVEAGSAPAAADLSDTISSMRPTIRRPPSEIMRMIWRAS